MRPRAPLSIVSLVMMEDACTQSAALTVRQASAPARPHWIRFSALRLLSERSLLHNLKTSMSRFVGDHLRPQAALYTETLASPMGLQEETAACSCIVRRYLLIAEEL